VVCILQLISQKRLPQCSEVRKFRCKVHNNIHKTVCEVSIWLTSFNSWRLCLQTSLRIPIWTFELRNKVAKTVETFWQTFCEINGKQICLPFTHPNHSIAKHTGTMCQTTA
jgi:hypothetical protein